MALPSLSPQQIRKIEGLIQGWTTKLTWDLLVQRIEIDLDINTTRQTLDSYKSIKDTFQNRKQELRGNPTEALIKFTKKDIKMAKQIERLEAEKATLTSRIERQQAFISEIATIAKTNPAVINVLERVKLKVSKNSER